SVGQQRPHADLLCPGSCGERRKLVRKCVAVSPELRTSLAGQDRFPSRRPFCRCRSAGLPSPRQGWTLPGQLSAPSASHEAERWHDENLSLGEFILLALPGQPPTC